MQKRIMNFTVSEDVHQLPFAEQFPEIVDNIDWVLQNLHIESACVPVGSDEFVKLEEVNGTSTTTWQQIIENFLNLHATSAQYLLFDHQGVFNEITINRTRTDASPLQMFYYGDKCGDLAQTLKMLQVIDNLVDFDSQHLIDRNYLPYVKASWMFYLIRGIYQQALSVIQKQFPELQIDLDLDYRYLDISLNITRKETNQC